MEFKKYSKIENSYRSTFISKVEAALPQGLATLCTVQEKIHGTNFAIYYNGEEMKLAKRSGFCDEDFYGCGDVVDLYKDRVKTLFGLIQDDFESEGHVPHTPEFVHNIIVYGELAGDGVQKGISYGDKDFYVFDIKVNGTFLPPSYVRTLAIVSGLKHAPLIADRITMREALNMNETFKSLVKPDVEGDNYAEGFVIKPMSVVYLPNGSRIVIKKKAEKFSEIGGTKVKVAKPVESLSLEDSIHVDSCEPYINENRLRAVLSKIERPTQKEFGKVAGLLLQDALEDYEKDFEVFLRDVANKYRLINKALMNVCTTLVRMHWVNILEGEF